MERYILLLLVVAFVAYVTSSPRRGICLSLCGPDSHFDCPENYECRSNGCGFECFRPANYTPPEGCVMNDDCGHCSFGYVMDKNGCDTCECDYSSLVG